MEQKEEKRNVAYIKIEDLTDEEIMLVLKHRSKQGKKGFKYFLSKEPFYIFKDIRTACMRELVRCGFLYLLVKYGLNEVIKR